MVEALISGAYILTATQLLIHLLSQLSTHVLLPLTAVSHRFHNLILRILHHRLLMAASLEDQRLMLECYHPSAKYTSPPMYCDYLGTDGLSNATEGEGNIYTDVEDTGRLAKLAAIYSHFRPLHPDEGKRVYRPHPAGGVPNHPDTSTTYPSLPSPGASSGVYATRSASQIINLDTHELFTQLCVATHLVRDGPRGGMYRSFVTVGEGIIRVWRDWLAEQSQRPRSSGNGLTLPTRVEQGLSEQVLWVDSGEKIGIRVKAREKRWRGRQPVLMPSDEDVAVSYTIELEGKQPSNVARVLVFSCSRLLDRCRRLHASIIPFTSVGDASIVWPLANAVCRFPCH